LQGIFNIFVVIPQFLITGFAALLFAITDPAGNRPPVATLPDSATNITSGMPKKIIDSVIEMSGHMIMKRAEAEGVPHSNSVVYLLRYVVFIRHFS